MGWAIGFIDGRDVGYGVPCQCEYPTCKKKIDRGLSYACGDWPGSNEYGCGNFFCDKHMHYYENEDGDMHQACDRCCRNYTLPDTAISEDWLPGYPRKPDLPVWIRWKLKDKSWEQWREDNPVEVKEMQATLEKAKVKK